MSDILIVGDDKQVSRQNLLRRRKNSRSVVTSWQDFTGRGLGSQVRDTGVDVIVFDLEASGAPSLEVALKWRQKEPGLGFVYVIDISDRMGAKTLAALSEPGVTWVSKQASRNELELRLQGLIDARKHSRRHTDIDAGNRSPWQHLLPELHSPKSGRLDAMRIAEWFGLTVKTMASVLDRGYAGLHKTPDAASIQDSLHVFLRIASALMRLAESHKAALVWLNAPNPELENNQTPLSAIEAREQTVIADMLEDSLVGQPA